MDLDKIDILSLVQYTGVQIEKSGSVFQASCPFHSDKTPSLKIYPSTNSFYCFGCSIGGNAITWVRKLYGYSIHESYEWLEGYAPEISEIDIRGVLHHPPVASPLLSLDMVDYWHINLQHTKQDSWFLRRGFTAETVARERFGWDGTRYIIPVWKGAPGQSEILTIRRRRVDGGDGPKYLTPPGTTINFVWGRWYTRSSRILIMFAGELDAALATQDGLPANSLVGGQGSFRNFPENWPSIWYPNAKHLLVMLDHQEADQGGLLANEWAKCKGSLTCDVIHWLDDHDDYNEYRMTHPKNQFLKMLGCQSTIALQLSQF